MRPVRVPALILALIPAVALLATAPRSLQAQDDGSGSVGAGLVGGVAGGAAGLLGVYPLLGCPLATLGASRAMDFCDVASVASALGGVAAGAYVGGTDSGAGYGMGMGLLAGLGAGLLLGRVVDTPRWVDSLFIVAGAVAGGLLGRDDDDGGEIRVTPDAQRLTPLFTLPVVRF